MKIKIEYLKCVHEIGGFTLKNHYPIIDNGANLVTVFDNNGILRIFNKVEGNKDFKNWFMMTGENVEIVS